MSKLLLTVIILTYNEEQHIERCIKSINNILCDIYIIDSFSTDTTVEIATSMGAKVLQNEWPNNHSVQFNWGLEHIDISTEWVMRLDADEVISKELLNEIKNELSNQNNSKTDAFILKRGHIFLGKKMLHGANFPTEMLRIWRNDKAYCENKFMDEHIVLYENGEVKLLKEPFWDYNLNNIGWWTDKHNGYATKEAIEQLNNKYNFLNNKELEQTTFKKFIKYNIYEKMPKSLRAFLYFHYRYIFRLGFLDGYQGLIWNFLQGFWYRFLVDVKVYELEKKLKENNLSLKEIIKAEYGYEL